MKRADGDAHTVSIIIAPFRDVWRVEPEGAGRDELVLSAQLDEDLGAAELAVRIRRYLVMHCAAPGLEPDDPARLDGDVVIERVAAARAGRQILEHVSQSGEAGMRVRAKRPATDAEIVEHGDRRSLLALLVQPYAVSGEGPSALPPDRCDDRRKSNRHGSWLPELAAARGDEVPLKAPEQACARLRGGASQKLPRHS